MTGSKIGQWNLFQGVVYMILSAIFIFFPQTFDMFDDSLTNFDYKYGQLMAIVTFVIGIIYVENGIPNLTKAGLTKLIGIEYGKNIQGAEHLFAVQSIGGRVLYSPLVYLIIILAFGKGKGDTVIVAFSVIFIILDVILGALTIFVLKKYGNDQHSVGATMLT